MTEKTRARRPASRQAPRKGSRPGFQKSGRDGAKREERTEDRSAPKRAGREEERSGSRRGDKTERPSEPRRQERGRGSSSGREDRPGTGGRFRREEREGSRAPRGEERQSRRPSSTRGEEREGRKPLTARGEGREGRRPSSIRGEEREGRKPFSARGGESEGRRPSSSRGMEREGRRPAVRGDERGGFRTTRAGDERGERRPAPRGERKPGFSTVREERAGKPFAKGSRPPERDGRPLRVAESPRVPAGMFMWGRRPIESYLGEFGERELSAADHSLHIIVDKQGRAPSQLRSVVELAKACGIPLHSHRSAEEGWPLITPEPVNHQRVCLKVPELPLNHLEDAVEAVRAAVAQQVKGCVGVVLDHVEDPGNFGAILRASGFFGQRFVAFPKDRQAPLTPAVLRVSAGGAFATSLIEIVNVARALNALKEAGAWIVGAHVREDAVDVAEVPRDRPYVLVVGNEARGLAQEVVRRCDYVVRIPGGSPAVDSLNVGMATGVMLFALGGAQGEVSEAE